MQCGHAQQEGRGSEDPMIVETKYKARRIRVGIKFGVGCVCKGQKPSKVASERSEAGSHVVNDGADVKVDCRLGHPLLALHVGQSLAGLGF